MLENAVQPVIDLRPGARSLESAFAALYDAFDERADRLASARTAIGWIDQAASELGPGKPLDGALELVLDLMWRARCELSQTETLLAPLIQRLQPPPPELRASRDVPELHAVARPSLRPSLRVPEPPPPKESVPEAPAIPKPKSFEELDAAIETLKQSAEERRQQRAAKRAAAAGSNLPASPPDEEEAEPPPGFVRKLPPTTTPLACLSTRARECFEEVAMIGMQRAPLLGDPWRGTRFLETRMLNSLDAIVALGPYALGQLEAWVRDAPAKDPARLFAIGMVLGCVEGRDALAAAERTFMALESGDPEMVANFGAAMKLVPHPLLPLVMRTFLGDSSPAYRALAIDVLGYRRLATLDELGRAAVDVPEVASVALPYLALARHPNVRQLVDAALEVDSPPLRAAAWIAMALSAHPRAPELTFSELAGEQQERAAQVLCLVGDAYYNSRLLELARTAPTRPIVTALGWGGAASAILPLMGFLEHDDAAVKLAAAYALDRITGAGLYEMIEVEPEEIDVPDVPEPAVSLGGTPSPKLVRLTSDPRDLPPEGSADALQQPTTDLARWQAYWQEKGQHYDPAARYRRGMPYSPNVSLGELDWAQATPGERRMLVRELVVRTGGYVPLDPHDFIAVQEKALTAWAPIAARASSSPGSWSMPRERGT